MPTITNIEISFKRLESIVNQPQVKFIFLHNCRLLLNSTEILDDTGIENIRPQGKWELDDIATILEYTI